MPFYADPQFNTPVLVPIVGLATGTATSGTSTANASALTVAVFPVFIRRTKVANVQVVVVTAPSANYTGEVLNFLNGTNTFAVATIGTLTAGQSVTAVGNTNGTFAAGGQITGTSVGTATITAGSAGGVFAIWLDQQELYA